MVSRRDFVRLTTCCALAAAAPKLAAAAAAPAQTSRLHIIDMANAAYFDRDQVPDGLDGTNACRQVNDRFLANLRDRGVDTIIRYYSDRNNAGLNCKNITVRERDLLHDFDFAVGIVYQYNGRARDRYTMQTADHDSRFILERAKRIGQPEGSTIYIGVDSDRSLNTDENILAYFALLNARLTPQYRIGVYAAGSRCRLLKERGLASFFWIPEAPAWDGTQAFLNSGDWTFFQNKTEVGQSALTRDVGQAVRIDTSIVNPAAGNSIGAFKRDGTIKTYGAAKLETIAAHRKWVNVPRLEILDRPQGRPVGHSCVARTIHVLSESDGWAEVDRDEDGLSDGYCRSGDLAPLAEMPRWKRGCVPARI
ncbi:glycoside hydrolase domain-containing protein [Rhizobium halophytocola]|uniref:Rv2525c-like glycoside hydrolase-like domain-containing protein n=1 Tax=Rhizobium halophytocola TaxID=735519 RepID=A0ABS4E5X8_9HYPH|nr:glycoside hydrolase domain-containing protein [Rhizobium halophytocola]MBP1853322.1 hypothetical protein [Rhizobium halophytocola]